MSNHHFYYSQQDPQQQQHQQQRHHHHHASSSINFLNNTIVSHVPQEAQIHWKRPRSASSESLLSSSAYPQDDSMGICHQPSLKRRRINDVMDGSSLFETNNANDSSMTTTTTATAIHSQQQHAVSPLYDRSGDAQTLLQESPSVDVASLAEESSAQHYPQSYHLQQRATSVSDHLYHFREQQQQHQQHQSSVHREQQYNVFLPPDNSNKGGPRIEENQYEGGPGQDVSHSGIGCSNGITPHSTNYQPMNSLLGELHMMRRRHRQGGNGEGSTRLFGNEVRQTIPQSYSHNLPTQHEQHQQGGNHNVRPPPRKKVVSLRVTSNIY